MNGPESNDEIEVLRHRIAELERRSEDRRRRRQELEEMFRHVSAVTNEAISIIEQGVYIDCNAEFHGVYGYTRDEILGRSPVDLVAPEFRELVAHNIRTGYDRRFEGIGLHKDGTRFIMQVHGGAVSYEGRTVRVSASIDITEQRRAEEARRAAAVQQQVIDAQAQMIARLSTPLLPISDGIVVLPLVGEVNAARGGQIMETLARGVFAYRAAFAILDITGIRAVDATVADLLIRAAQAVQLLGAEAILTGLRPEVALAVAELGRDLGGIVVLGTLQDGVARALGRTAA